MSKEQFQAILKGADPPDQSASTSGLEAIKAALPGLSLSKIVSGIGAELKHLGAQGSHEMAAALFRGDAFVMYAQTGQEAEAQVQATPEQQPEQSLGREM